jgi:uncharacterized protein YegJ (DUF2314 family)
MTARNYITLFACLFLVSCGAADNAADNSAGANPGNADPTMHVEQDNEALLSIALDAQENLHIFFRHLQRPSPGERDFRIKYPFEADTSSGFYREQIWLDDITFSNGIFSGTVINTPFFTQGIAKGDRTAFDPDGISDWMFMRKDKIIGGLSIKYLLELISAEDRSEQQADILKMFE